MRLHENPDDFKTLIRAASQNLKIREVYVEKDYWLTFLLYRLAKLSTSNDVVFKGGTSLSKGYKLIRRFSEDVDLAVLRGSKTNSQIERLIKQVSKSITAAPFEEVLEEDTTSKKGFSRRTLHQYPRSIERGDFGTVRDSLLLEINAFSDPWPSQPMPIQSFLAEYLSQNNQQAVLTEFALIPFAVPVLDYRKTFTEKILSLSYASFADGDTSNRETRARIRHFYDLTRLFAQEEIRFFLESPDFPTWTRQIRQEEKLFTRIKWTEHKLSDSRLHRETEKALADIRPFFRADLEPLVFLPEDLPSFEKVEETFSAIAKAIRNNDL